MSIEEKVICCHNNLNNNSIAKIVGCSRFMVYHYLNKNDLNPRTRNMRKP